MFLVTNVLPQVRGLRLKTARRVLLNISARFKPSLREPRFKQTELGGPRRFTLHA